MVVTCALCGEVKPATGEHFYRHRDGSFYSPCKTCARAAQKARRAAKRALSPKPSKPELREGHKFCPKCGGEKPLEEFRATTVKGKPRRQSWCMACERAAASARKKTPEGRERARLRRRQWCADNPEKVSEQAKALRAKNHERAIARSREQYRKHRAKRLEYSRNRNALLRQLETGGEFITDQEIAIQYSRQRHKCYYCGIDIGKDAGVRGQVDHYIPLARGGRNIACNIVIACSSCNNRKWAKMPWEFRPDLFTEGQLTPL